MKKAAVDGYRPTKVTRTLGQRPACLVNASVTYCGNNQIYAFGGFDQYTDEVYNHVLRLDLIRHEWSLVDNYGDIPGVRMGKIWHWVAANPESTLECFGFTDCGTQVTRQRYTKATSSWSLVARTSIVLISPTS